MQRREEKILDEIHFKLVELLVLLKDNNITLNDLATMLELKKVIYKTLTGRKK